MKKHILILSALFALCACHRQQAPLTVHWELLANDVEPGICEAALTLTNTGTDTLRGEGWWIGFSLMSLHPLDGDDCPVVETERVASYHTLAPKASFTPLAPGQSQTYRLRYRGSAVRESSHPEGFFLVQTTESGELAPVSLPATHALYTRMEQMTRGIKTWDPTPYADGEYMHAYIRTRRADAMDGTEQLSCPFVPQPKELTQGDRLRRISTLPRETHIDPSLPQEGYRIEIDDSCIRISAADDDGLYYASLTLAQMGEQTAVTAISDYPDLPVRAVMLDVARNFYPADSIRRVLDVMAELKLNTLHLHLTDDEGWRIEIAELPELTAIGSRRGYSPEERECLAPAYCGGWDYTAPTTANGYITRAEYIDLLRYAAERHIRVIPEIDMPGHMRAMKKAMGGLLTDSLLEKRTYLSAQNYTDNVIAVTRPEAIRCIRIVIESLIAMHREAGCPLRILNIGGDEVPRGALTQQEHQLFIDNVLAILQQYDLQPAGWEEIDHFCSPDTRAICYSWRPSGKKALEMADKGYPVVLAMADHLYFDFAYCHQHEEKGLNWGGYTDEFASFDWQPLQHPNVIGMSGQLWAEVIRSFAQVEWQLYPKMYGLSERAWNNQSKLSVNSYAKLVYGTYLPKLAAQGSNFHLMQPGIHIESGTVLLSSIYPAGEIIYTLEFADGRSEQALYTAPFALPADVRLLKAQWHYLGHRSNTSWLFVGAESTAHPDKP